ncbi:MAG: exodeoxyribonuclease VII large subunit [Butyrivibrio sp.]|nr:exodeoxyribonuclease VII large subunit [Butyrivibrio sp.]
MPSEYTVTKLNAYIKNMFASDFLLRNVCVRGEVSNCKYHTSGHIYFTLKDKGAAVSCVMFKGDAQRGLHFRMDEGQQVRVTGSVTVYERDGKYQIYCRSIVRDGDGTLYEQFEALKKRLSESGMFSEEYKQPIPRYIRTLGVVTAPTGAAVRDIINVASRRNPHIQIILYPAIVQGEEAAESIVNGIIALSRAQVDVMIVGRGGGSIEDLWAFNEEIVAQAIFDCPVPIISAVGHETDTTIADYVSDRRAPTPSAAAELAVFEYKRFTEDLEDYRRILSMKMDVKVRNLYSEEKRLLDALKHLSPMAKVRDRQQRLDSLNDLLATLMENRLKAARHRLDVDIEKLKGLSPLDRLKGGYSYMVSDSGTNIRSIRDTRTGDEIIAYVSDGRVSATVTGVTPEDYIEIEDESNYG